MDALHDKLTGASFEVSAGGAQRDTIISNDTNRDSSWDGVWESAVSIDREGWTIEMRIPLSQLRFLRGDRQTWGFNAERFIYRKNERVWFHLIPRTDNALMSRAADLTDIDGVEPRRTLELMPYTAARSEFVRAASGNPFNDGSRYFGATGLDINTAPRPNIVVNAAINPDFGQVEIDPAVVNLGAFETFFQEKRPFFIEGAQIFTNFGGLGANNGWGFNRSEPNLVHTRRLGRVPQGDASGDFVDCPTATTILGAAKLTGKSNNGWSFGVLDTVTDREHTRTSTFGQESRVETEPLTNYFAGRVLKEFGVRPLGAWVPWSRASVATSTTPAWRNSSRGGPTWPVWTGITSSTPARSGWSTGGTSRATCRGRRPPLNGFSWRPSGSTSAPRRRK